jgi:hypothetical protein
MAVFGAASTALATGLRAAGGGENPVNNFTKGICLLQLRDFGNFKARRRSKKQGLAVSTSQRERAHLLFGCLVRRERRAMDHHLCQPIFLAGFWRVKT